MAYTIPVVALIIDPTSAANALGLDPGYFEDQDEYRREGVEDLAALTAAPVTAFSDEDGDCFYVGIELASDFYVEIDSTLLSRAVALKGKYPHPLIQAAKLAVVSRFC